MKEIKIVEDDNGDKIWYLNGKYHREDGADEKMTSVEPVPPLTDDEILTLRDMLKIFNNRS